MFICDCHCDTLTELYKKGTALYENEQHLDIKRIIANGGGLQFCAIYVQNDFLEHLQFFKARIQTYKNCLLHSFSEFSLQQIAF